MMAKTFDSETHWTMYLVRDYIALIVRDLQAE